MRKLLKCEYMKTRRLHILPTALVIIAVSGIWSFYNSSSSKDLAEFIHQNGWLMLLYQLPLCHSIFLPILASVVASNLCSAEHKGSNLKLICTYTSKGRLYDAKLLYGLSISVFCVILFWCITLMYGLIMGYEGGIPWSLYLHYLLFTLLPTIAIYCFQHALSMLFANQAVPFFAGVLGQFAGLFSLFLPQYPILRNSILWGYYGALQFVGLYDWSKETRFKYARFEHMGYNWSSFLILCSAVVLIYVLGKWLFCKKEL